MDNIKKVDGKLSAAVRGFLAHYKRLFSAFSPSFIMTVSVNEGPNEYYLRQRESNQRIKKCVAVPRLVLTGPDEFIHCSS